MFALGLYVSLSFSQGNSPSLSDLLLGNQRFVSQKAEHPRQDQETRVLLAKGQKPKAVIVCCSDSRVAPEILFDQGLGDLFVVRCAGNSVDKIALGSIEYAVLELHANLVVVLGHEKCGAVKAALEGHKLPGALPSVVAPIKHAVLSARKQKGDPLHNAVAQHVRDVASQVSRADAVMRQAVKSKKVQVIGGVYSLDTGVVKLLDFAR